MIVVAMMTRCELVATTQGQSTNARLPRTQMSHKGVDNKVHLLLPLNYF